MKTCGEWMYSLNFAFHRLDEPQSRSGRCGEEKKSLALVGNETSAVHPIALRNTD
jgi:hypothetical protein